MVTKIVLKKDKSRIVAVSYDSFIESWVFIYIYIIQNENLIKLSVAVVIPGKINDNGGCNRDRIKKITPNRWYDTTRGHGGTRKKLERP